MQQNNKTVPQRLLENLNIKFSDGEARDEFKSKIEAIFPYAYQERLGGVQEALFADILAFIDSVPQDKQAARKIRDVFDVFSSTHLFRRCHPMDLSIQSVESIIPVLDFFDALDFRLQVMREQPLMLLGDSFTRGDNFCWSGFLKNIKVSVNDSSHEFIYKHFGKKFGEAVNNIWAAALISTNALGSGEGSFTSARNKLINVFSKIDSSHMSNPVFLNAFIPTLPLTQVVGGLVFMKVLDFMPIENIFDSSAEKWFTRCGEINNLSMNKSLNWIIAEMNGRSENIDDVKLSVHFALNESFREFGEKLINSPKPTIRAVRDFLARPDSISNINAIESAVLKSKVYKNSPVIPSKYCAL